MQYRFFGRTGVKVSVACMGSMTFGREIASAESMPILDRFAEAGGTFIDTADNIYSDGESERIVGKWLSGKKARDQWVVATKVGFPSGKAESSVGLSRKHIFEAIDASLSRLQTDYVDVYQLHWWDMATPIEETLRALADLVSAGKVRYIGCSNLTAWQIVRALAVSDAHGWPRFASLQPMYSLLMRDADLELLPVCTSEGMAVLPYSPLARGALTGKHSPETVMLTSRDYGLGTLSEVQFDELLKAGAAERRQRVVSEVGRIAEAHAITPARIALAWAAQREGVAALILGARSVAQLDDNLGFVDVELTADDLERLDNVSRTPLPYPHDYLNWANGEYGRTAARR